MATLQSQLSTGSAVFQENAETYRGQVEDLHRRRREAAYGADPKAADRHVASGKLLPRDRVQALLDPGSPFMEIGMLCGGGSSGAAPLGAGIITGVGRIKGRICMVIANDSTVRGGTYHAMTARKHVRAQKVAA